MASSRASCDIITPLLRDIQDSTAFLEGHESPSSEDSLSLAVVEADRFSRELDSNLTKNLLIGISF